VKIQRYKRDGDVSYSLGMAPTMELLLARPYLAERVFVSAEAARGEALARLEGLCAAHGVPVEVGEKPFHVLSPKGNCFAIGVFRKGETALRGFADGANHVVLVSPQDAGNVGTILRTAVGFGFLDVAVVLPGADPFDPKTVRASMGAIFRARVRRYESFEAYRREHPSHNLYPFMLGAHTPLHEASFDPPFALAFGNEASGLPPAFAGVGTPVVIPHAGDIDSLNLPVACGIALYAASSYAKLSRQAVS